MASFSSTHSTNGNLATLPLNRPIYAMVQSSFNRNVGHALFFAFFLTPVPLGLITLLMTWRHHSLTW